MTVEKVSISDRTLECAAGSFQLSHVAGVRIAEMRGSYAGRFVGMIAFLIAIGYGGCFLVADAMTGDHSGAIIVFAMAIGGLGLFLWGKWGGAPRYVVVLNIGGREVAAAEFLQRANADRVVTAVRTALQRFAT